MARLTSVEREAEARGIVTPAPSTLRRYGLTLVEWLRLLASQGWVCPICERGTGVRWATDHDHVVGWKRMAPEIRKTFVRGVLCIRCNWKRVDSRMSAAEAQRIATYLKRYEARRNRGK